MNGIGRLTEGEFRNRIDTMGLPYLRVSISSHCNAACGFCHNEGQRIGKRGTDARAEPSFLTLKQYEYIARFFASQFKTVKFTGGEPTLTENLPEVVKIFKDKGYSCSMTTNGFLLNGDLQTTLKKAGLSRINISLPSLNPVDHGRFFGVADDYFHRVLDNLRLLGKIYGSQGKINFMAIKGQNVPSQLVPITELSAETGLIVSCMELANVSTLKNPISDEIIDHLDREIGIASRTNLPDTFSHKTIIAFKNGGRWEIDDFRRSSYRESAFANDYCQRYPVKEKCVEGPYALRILFDGTVRPCLIRGDNVVALGPEGYQLEA